jgi:hypothetical protein
MKTTTVWLCGAFMLLLSCGEPTGPAEPVMVSDGAFPTSLRVYAASPPPGDEAPVPQVLEFTQAEVTVYGTRRHKLKFIGPNGCTVDLTMPFHPGIYQVGATETKETPAFGSLNCGALGGSRTLTGEIVILDSNVDHDGGESQLSMIVGKLKWVGSGTQHFGGDVYIAAKAPPPPEEELPTGSIVCPGSVPSGYWCVTVGAASAPVKWKNLTKGPSGSYRNSGMGVCMTLNSSNGISTFTMDGGIGGGSTTYTSKWGATVASNGVVSLANGSIMNIITGAQDFQILLLNWNNAGAGSWVQGGWTKGC